MRRIAMAVLLTCSAVSLRAHGQTPFVPAGSAPADGSTKVDTTNGKLTTPTITGGTIDNTCIGCTTPNKGAFTNLNATQVVGITGGGIEVGPTTGGASSTSFLDFHSSGQPVDYDARISSTGGTSSTAQGSLRMRADGGITTVSAGFTSTAGQSANPSDAASVINGMRIRPGSLVIASKPYSSEDPAVVLSAMTDPNGITGFNGGFGAGLPAYANFGGIDSGAFYFGALPVGGYPLMTLTGMTIGATQITFPTPLTAAQVAAIRPNMWLTTNNTSTAAGPWGTLVQSVDPNGTFITVRGWTQMGSGNSSTGQVPSGALIAGSGSAQALYVSATTQNFGGNIVSGIDATPGSATNAVGLEIDMINNTPSYTSYKNSPAAIGIQMDTRGTSPGTFGMFCDNFHICFSAGDADYGFSYGSAGTSTTSALISRQTAGKFLELGQFNSPDIFSVDALGNTMATSYAVGSTAGVSCAAGTVNLATFTVTKGIVTHC